MAYKILVVDDDLAILRLIKKVLEYEKYEVVIRNKIEDWEINTKIPLKREKVKIEIQTGNRIVRTCLILLKRLIL